MEQEQNLVNPVGSETDGKVEENSYGKFSDANELYKAYVALESEFTRRSQKLKEYEKSFGEIGKSSEERKQELTRKFNVAPDIVEEAARRASAETNGRIETSLIGVLNEKMLTPEQMASDSMVIDKVLSDKKNREAVINEYIEKIRGVDVPISSLGGGESPALPPYRPTTVKEAGEIAKAIIKQL